MRVDPTLILVRTDLRNGWREQRVPLRKLVMIANTYASKTTMMVTSGIEGPEIADARPNSTNAKKSEVGRGARNPDNIC